MLNPKFEARNSKQIRNSNFQMTKMANIYFGHSDFANSNIVSDFEFRASNLTKSNLSIRYTRRMKKAAAIVYVVVVALGIAAAASSNYIYRKLTVMQIRYEASRKPQGEPQASEESLSASQESGIEATDDFIYEKFYKPVRGAVDEWKGHVKDSLEVEKERMQKESGGR